MSISKQFIFHEKCRQELFKGIQIMYDAVSATLGPHGRTILLEKVAHSLEPTKDGVTVANEVYSPEKWKDLGMQLVREASQKANTMAGDATTTAIVLAYQMCKEGLAAVAKRANVYQVSKGMKIATETAVKRLEELSRKITEEEDFRKVAVISTQDEEVGKIIAKTFIEAGECGSIDIERSDDPGIKAEKTEGISFDKGWGSSLVFNCYINDLAKKRCVQEDIPVLVVENKLENENQLIPLMEALCAPPPPAGTSKEEIDTLIEERNGWPFGIRKMIVVCDEFSGSAVSLLVANNKRNQQTNSRFFHLIFTKAPSYGIHKIETMKDICTVTDASFFSEEHGGKRVEYATLADLGRAKKIIIEEERTIIVAEPSEDRKKGIQERIEFIQNYLKDMPQDHLERKEWELRLATLTDGISVLKVGAESENERHELRRRVEDGVKAAQSAREEGVTPGCGVGLLQCIESVDKCVALSNNPDEIVGIKIVQNALSSVTMRLLEVAFIEDFSLPKWRRWLSSPQAQRRKIIASMLENMRKGDIANCGYDFRTDTLADMLKNGVFDAKKAVRVALQGACSVATTFLKIDGALGEINDADTVIGGIRDLILQR